MWWALLACHGDDLADRPGLGSSPDEGTGILGTGWANPFPNAGLVGPDGLDLRDLPDPGETDLPLDRLAWRTGFSPVQSSVLRLDGVSPDGLPSFTDVRPGEGTVRMVDLTDGSVLPCMAELDAFEGATEVALIVRPLVAVPVGHRVGVAVLDGAVERPERFDLMLSETPPASLAAVAPHYRDLVADLSELLDVSPGEVAVAWDFPIGDGTRPLRSALEQLTVPGGHTFTEIRDLDAGDDVAPLTWRAAEGTFAAPDFLIGDRALDLQPDGSVLPTGAVDAYLYVHLPTSVRDRPAGSVPVLLFGHGIFGSPRDYLDRDNDPSRVLKLADELGAIVIATTWRGFTRSDQGVALQVGADFGRFHELTDLLVQGQVNARALLEYARAGDLLDDPVFTGASGQALPDRSRVYYYGISLGAIEGAVFLAQDPPIDAAAMHVGGGMWSTMLERSSNWPLFELLLMDDIPNAADRQVLYALTQLWWDPVDPVAWTAELAERPFLLQESVGDEQVPNLATEVLARSVGLPLLTPTDLVPYGLAAVEGPLPPGSRALVRFDPEVPLPDTSNRPAAITYAHSIPRTWDGARLQVIDHLMPGLDGQVVHHCGDAVCSASNPGPAQ